jgi:hypothetical protein
VALLCGLVLGPRGGGLKAVEATIGLEPVKEIEPRFAGEAAETA